MGKMLAEGVKYFTNIIFGSFVLYVLFVAQLLFLGAQTPGKQGQGITVETKNSSWRVGASEWQLFLLRDTGWLSLQY